MLNHNKNKVAIVGAGFVGSTTAYTIMMDGSVSEISIIDKNKKLAEGHALDLMHGMQFTRSIKIVAGDSFELVKNARIVVIAAGCSQKPGQTRSELLKTNASIFKNIIPKIVKYNKDCILLVVTNPLDALTYLTYKLSGFPSCRVFGTGTVLDTSRLRYLIASELNISPKDITSYILGEHGDNQFVWWSHANIGGIPLSNFVGKKEFFKQVHESVKNAVYNVISKKGATYYAISLVVTKIVRAILLNQSRVFPVSTVLENYKGVNNICMSIPTIIKENGIYQKLDIELNSKEEGLFNSAAKKIMLDIKQANI